MKPVKFSSSLPEHAREVWQARAAAAEMTDGAWLARAIYNQAARDASAEPVDPDVTAFLDATQDERFGMLGTGATAA